MTRVPISTNRDAGAGTPSFLRRFAEDTRGGMTLEFVIWLPVFLVTIASSVDASILFVTHSQMWDAARATARNMSVGTIRTPQEAQAFANGLLPTHGSFSVVADFDYAEDKMKLQILGSKVGILGNISLIGNADLVAVLIVRSEIEETTVGPAQGA